MSTPDGYSVILFESSSKAILAERLLQGSGFSVKLMPTPRHLSSDCGVSMKILSGDTCGILSLLKENRITNTGVHELF